RDAAMVSRTERLRPGLGAACRREVIGDRNRSPISRWALDASRRLRYADRHLAREGSGGQAGAAASPAGSAAEGARPTRDADEAGGGPVLPGERPGGGRPAVDPRA